MNTTTPVVVIEDKKRRKSAAFIVVGALALAAAGGSTFALWSAQDTFTGGQITAGDLNIAQQAPTSFFDVSGDRADATSTVTGTDGAATQFKAADGSAANESLGHTLDPTTWRMVPGDTVAATESSTVTLVGDNLVARLSMDDSTITAGSNTAMSYKYAVFQDGKQVVAPTDLPAASAGGNDVTLAYLSATGNGQAAGAEDANGAPTIAMNNANGSDVFTVVVYGTFNQATANRDQATTVSDTMGAMNVNLTQVRNTGAQFK